MEVTERKQNGMLKRIKTIYTIFMLIFLAKTYCYVNLSVNLKLTTYVAQLLSCFAFRYFNRVSAIGPLFVK